jgi:hypothetical protein
VNEIPNPTGVEALIRRISNRIDPAERIKIGVVETESVSMARLLLKKARASMNVNGQGGAPAIASFEHVLYHFAISFGELCSRIPQAELRQALSKDRVTPANKGRRAPGASAAAIIYKEAEDHWHLHDDMRGKWDATARKIRLKVLARLRESKIAPKGWPLDDRAKMTGLIGKRLQRHFSPTIVNRRSDN